jgi:hypothetical protein
MAWHFTDTPCQRKPRTFLTGRTQFHLRQLPFDPVQVRFQIRLRFLLVANSSGHDLC